MNAAQAKKIATDHLRDYSSKELSAIMEKIETTAKAGRFTAQHYGDLHDVTQQKLRADGFALKHENNYDPRDPRESAYWVISWN